MGRHMHFAGALLVGIGVLIGCAAPPEGAAVTSQAREEEPVESAVSEASIRQYASVVARHNSDALSLHDSYIHDNTSPSMAEVINEGAAANAAALSSDLGSLPGEPPAEIRSLVGETRAAADTLAELAEAAERACATATFEDYSACTTASGRAFGASGALVEALEAWGPYL
jgi:hypothetical protein